MQWPMKSPIWFKWPISNKRSAHLYASVVPKSLRNPTANEKEPIREQCRGREGTPEADWVRDLWYKSSMEKRERECLLVPFSLPFSLSFILCLWILSLSFCLNLSLSLSPSSFFLFVCGEVNSETIINYMVKSMWIPKHYTHFVCIIPAPRTLMCS